MSNDVSLRFENVSKDVCLLMLYLFGIITSSFSVVNLYSVTINKLYFGGKKEKIRNSVQPEK